MKILHIVLLVVSALAVGLLSACGSTDEISDPVDVFGPSISVEASADVIVVEGGTPRLTRVQPIPGQMILSPGETANFFALAFDQQGREISGATFSWQIIDPKAGTITPSGLFRSSFDAGSYDEAIIVTARTLTDSGPKTVEASAGVTLIEFASALQPASIRVLPDPLVLVTNETLALFAIAVDSNGATIPNLSYGWEMLEPLAGSITQDGGLTASTNVGFYSEAVQVTLPSQEEGDRTIITKLDMEVLDPQSPSARVSVTVLPQLITIRPGEEIRFTTLILDKQGNQIPTTDLSWEVLDIDAGTISEIGLFTAGETPGTFTKVVRATMHIDDLEEPLEATGTVLIVDIAALGQGIGLLSNVSIFPDRMVLSPGESARLSIVGFISDSGGLARAEVQWDLDSSEVAELRAANQFAILVAGSSPGIYEDAIHAEVMVETEDGSITLEAISTLVIRGSLDSVEITPPVGTVEIGGRIQFSAVGYDINRVPLPDVTLIWSVEDPEVGTIDNSGLFTPKGTPGEFPGAVKVTAIQRQRLPDP